MMMYLPRSIWVCLMLSGTAAFGITVPVGAQINPDDTLGNDSSRVTHGVEVQGELADLIEGGAQRGSNLFHSFEAFNIEEGQRVYFANPEGIEFILSRVTGGGSNIFGTLGVDGAADLFLLNPNGIVFGETASLDVNGSFYATTAEAIALGDAIFSATEPEQSTLLAVNPSVSFFNYLTDASGDITNRGVLAVNNGENLALAANQLNIQGDVSTGNDLSLLATGDVEISNSTVGGDSTNGDLLIHGRNILITDSSVEMGGQGELGDMTFIANDRVEIRDDNNDDNNTAALASAVNGQGNASDISITATHFIGTNNDSQVGSGNAFIGTSGFDGGDSGNIIINVTETVLLDGFRVGTVASGDQEAGQSGNIHIKAVDLEMLNGAGFITGTRVEQTGADSGDSGNITIELTGTLSMRGFGESFREETQQLIRLPSSISSSPIGESVGNAGNINIFANNIDMDDSARLLSFSAGGGNGGAVEVEANQLQFRNGAAIASGTTGQGAAGEIFLHIDGTASFDGVAFDNSTSSSLSTETSGTGLGGNIRIEATNLNITNGAILSSSTEGMGDAGKITLEIAETARIDGRTPDGSGPSLITTDAIATYSNEGVTGDGNDLQITATRIEVTGGAQLSSSLGGTGRAGDIIFDAEAVLIQGPSEHDLPEGVGFSPSSIVSNIQETGNGEGGDILITANNLMVVNGGVLDASVLGGGAAGNVILAITETARFEGVGLDGLPSRVISVSDGNIEGNGGTIFIDAKNLEVLAGAQLTTTAFKIGDAGDIVLSITETARFDGANPVLSNRSSGVFSSTEGNGSGGDIHITAEALEITDEAILLAASFATGDAGSIFIDLRESLIARDGEIRADSAETLGGRIEINAVAIRLSGDSDILTNVETGEGRGGDIILIADTIAAFDDSDILAFSADGQGGDIVLNTPAFFGENFQLAPQLTTREELEALDGNDRVDVNATGSITSGTITIPDVSFLEDSLNELSGDLVDTEALTVGSCIARIDSVEGSFVITGNGGLPQRPNSDTISAYPTSTVRTIPDAPSSQTLQEPEGIYQLADGRLVLGHECQ